MHGSWPLTRSGVVTPSAPTPCRPRRTSPRRAGAARAACKRCGRERGGGAHQKRRESAHSTKSTACIRAAQRAAQRALCRHPPPPCYVAPTASDVRNSMHCKNKAHCKATWLIWHQRLVRDAACASRSAGTPMLLSRHLRSAMCNPPQMHPPSTTICTHTQMYTHPNKHHHVHPPADAHSPQQGPPLTWHQSPCAAPHARATGAVHPRCCQIACSPSAGTSG